MATSAPPTRLRATTIAQARESEAAALTRAEVAAILNVDARTVTRAIESGELPSIRLGRRRLIPIEPFLALMTGGVTSA